MDKIAKVNRDAFEDKQRLKYCGVKVGFTIKKKRNNEQAGLKIDS